jgi:hypothetical protein
MFFVKSCSRENNIKARKTVRVGSLGYYRNSEIAQIADKSEGMYDYEIDVKTPTMIPKSWMNSLTRGVNFGEIDPYLKPLPVKFSLHIKRIAQIFTSDEHVYVESAQVYVKSEDYDCFVFCISRLKSVKFAKKMFKDYDDCWAIDIKHAEKIADILSSKLLQKAKDEAANPTSEFLKNVDPDTLTQDEIYRHK